MPQNKSIMDCSLFTDIRKQERKLLEKAGFVQSGNSALAPIASTIAIVLTFTCHILLRRRLTAPVVRTISRTGFLHTVALADARWEVSPCLQRPGTGLAQNTQSRKGQNSILTFKNKSLGCGEPGIAQQRLLFSLTQCRSSG